MTPKSTNKIIPVIVIVGVVFVAAIITKGGDDNTILPAENQAQVPDGDSTADTLRTLTAKVVALSEENQKLLLAQQNLSDEIGSQPESETEDDLQARLARMVDDKFGNYIPNTMGEQSSLPDEEFDFDLGDNSADNGWVEPANEIVEMDENGLPVAANGNFSMSGISNMTADFMEDSTLMTDTALISEGLGLSAQEEEIKEPVYTIPRNSTFIRSTAMSALIGRIPQDGSVEDPYPVKIVVGRKNLAANGLELPEVSHMIFTGTAVGDWTLSCVRADLTSVTYVFQDGTIQSLSIDDGTLENATNRIGWLSDDRGVPCISGKRISNATTNLLGGVFAKGVEAAATAMAMAEETAVTSAQGDTVRNVTGDAMTNMKYKGLSGGAKEISTWLNKRAAQNFDVIYVDTGRSVSINIDVELPIDYKPNGRKLRHETSTSNRFTRGLD